MIHKNRPLRLHDTLVAPELVAWCASANGARTARTAACIGPRGRSSHDFDERSLANASVYAHAPRPRVMRGRPKPSQESRQ
jgi:hypothetical protein